MDARHLQHRQLSLNANGGHSHDGNMATVRRTRLLNALRCLFAWYDMASTTRDNFTRACHAHGAMLDASAAHLREHFRMRAHGITRG